MRESRHFASGVAFMALLATLVVLTVAQYQGAFRDTVRITVQSDRAGLTMTEGALVKLRGVQVGRVSSVKPTAHGASIELEIDKSKVSWISADAAAEIKPPTAFGAKYVQLTSDKPRSEDVINAGTTIRSDKVTVEVNEAFTNLASVLSAAQPDQVNNTVTALSEALEGRGTKIGELVTQVDTYLDTFNRTLPLLEDDLDKAHGVLDIYDGLAPKLTDLTGNVTTTAETLKDRQKSIDRVSRALDDFSLNGEDFVKANDDQVTELLNLLDPVTSMLEVYSPSLPCILGGVVVNDKMLTEAIGGKKPGVNAYTKIQPSDDPYKAPDGLPSPIKERGPDCFGLPHITQADADAKNPDFGTGANPYAGNPKSPDQELATTFFGVLAGLVNLG
jgi:phospholipid/cholesterol/gamma-HCH transport system substrate-binding protein